MLSITCSTCEGLTLPDGTPPGSTPVLPTANPGLTAAGRPAAAEEGHWLELLAAAAAASAAAFRGAAMLLMRVTELGLSHSVSGNRSTATASWLRPLLLLVLLLLWALLLEAWP